MNLRDLTHGLEIGVQRDDLSSDYKTFVQTALTSIQQRRSWICMKQEGEVTIGSQLTSARLPDNFKELSATRTPVHRQTDNGILIPCDVWTREKILRRNAKLLRNQLLNPNGAARIGIPVWVDWQDAVPTLNIGEGYVGPQTFVISYNGFLPPLEENTDSNYFTERYPEMCLHKAKAIAFQAINDATWEMCESLYEEKFKEAAASDAYAAIAGIELRM